MVIDAGHNPGNVGDADFDTARTRACLVTPVPGGVGPMTIAVPLGRRREPAWIPALLTPGSTLGKRLGPVRNADDMVLHINRHELAQMENVCADSGHKGNVSPR